MTRSLAVSFIVSASLLACGGGPDQSSPKGVAESVAAAFTAKDSAAAVALLPPVELLNSHFKCDPKDSLVEGRNHRAKRAASEVSSERTKGMKMSVGSFDEDGSETKELKVGDTWSRCEVLKPATFHRSKLTLVIEKDGKKEDDGESWPFLKLDGKWYLAKL